MVEGDTIRPTLSVFEDAIRLQYVSDLDPHPSVQLISALCWLSQFSTRFIGTLNSSIFGEIHIDISLTRIYMSNSYVCQYLLLLILIVRDGFDSLL